MAVFSRIVVWTAALAASSLLVTPVAGAVENGRAVARHLKHPQARAHHVHQSNNDAALAPRSKKRSGNKKRVCAAKNEAVSSSSSAEPTTTILSTSTSVSTSHSKTRTKTKTSSAAVSDYTPPSSGGGGNGNGGKAGLCWNDGTDVSMGPFVDGVSWYYTWSPWPGCNQGDKCPEFLPMFWSDKQASNWNSLTKGKHFKHILAINEPEQTGQSNMAVDYAVKLWWQYVEVANADKRGSPAVTTSPEGIAWLVDFMKQCSTCRVDFICIHWYGISVDDFKERVNLVHSKFPNHPIWVTEWAFHNYGGDKQLNQGEINDAMMETRDWLNSLDWVDRHAYFGPLTSFPGDFNLANRLLSADGHITNLGKMYIS